MRPEGREPLADKAGESTLLSRSGGEKGLRGGGAGIDPGWIPGSGRSPEWQLKGMATDSSILAKRIPWTEEPGGL